MSSFLKYRLSLGGFLLSSFLLIYLSLWINAAFVIAFFVNVLFWSWRLKTVRCAQCGSPLAPPIGSSVVDIFRSFCATECGNCNSKLD
ncbi:MULTISPECIES: hypothetical protein [unclassified Polaromonas]|uniref:hypothetical protein n=1 Tax=unclassified Polaromonas TaxID=2638319 RepID=UPI00129E7571|nr:MULTISPECIES: hypothetical protein [unclassified Polaromonas]QGJ19353.1 hypothetical protein F7R28_13755 [Polaromonas sp. Pch-P]